MNLQSVMGVFFKIIVLVAIGFGMKKKGIITSQIQKGLSTMLMAVPVPVSIVCSALLRSEVLPLPVFAKAVTMNALYFLLGIMLAAFISRKLFPGDDGARKIFTNMAVFQNVAFIGLPMITALLGIEYTFYAVISSLVYNIYLAFYAVPAMSGEKVNFRSFCTDPLNISSIVSVVLFFVPVHLPAFAADTLNSIAGLVVPLSMMIIGCQLADIHPKELVTSKLLYAVAAMRLLFFPIVIFIIMFVLGFDKNTILANTILFGMPSGSLNAVLAEKYGFHPKEAGLTVAGTTALMLVTMPVILVAAGILLK